MTSTPGTPAEAAQPEDLLAQALGQMQLARWDESMRLLEAAIEAAPEPMRGAAVEVLASVYVARNQHARLRDLMRSVDPFTPQMVKGALLLARNRALGMDGELPPHCNESSLDRPLRTHVVEGAYPPGDLSIIVALLAQLKWLDLAGPIAMVCTAAGGWIEPGVVERVFAALLESGRRYEAIELLGALKTAPPHPDRPIGRWTWLLEGGGAPPQDKLLRFLTVKQLMESGSAQPPSKNPSKEPTPC